MIPSDGGLLRGEMSEQLLDALAETFDKEEQEIMHAWASTRPEEADKREGYYHLVRAIRLVRRALISDINSVKINDAKIKRV